MTQNYETNQTESYHEQTTSFTTGAGCDEHSLLLKKLSPRLNEIKYIDETRVNYEDQTHLNVRARPSLYDLESSHSDRRIVVLNTAHDTYPVTKRDHKLHNQYLNKRVVINVGGVRFETYKSTLKLINESRLANLTPTNSDYDPIRKEYFFDRDPASFQSILNYFRNGKLHAPNSICGNLFYDELSFWGIDERSIQACCWTSYSTKRECDEILKKIMNENEDENSGENDEEDKAKEEGNLALSSISKKSHLNGHSKSVLKRCGFVFNHEIKPAVWHFLVDRKSSKFASVYYWISIVFFAISICNFVLETSPLCRIPYEVSVNRSLSRVEKEQGTAPHPILTTTELVCNIFFAIEFVIKLISSPDIRKFLRNPYYIMDFLALTPLFFPPEVYGAPKTWGVKIHNFIEVLYILRVLRIFSLAPKYSGLRVLLLTLRKSIRELLLYLILLLMTILLFASFIFYAEQIFEPDHNEFDSILISLWWAIVTIPFGYVIGAMCAITGLIFTALPIPIIVNNFTMFYSHAKASRQLKEYSEMQKSLPNRAKAMNFQSNEARFGAIFNNSIGKLNEPETYLDEDEIKCSLDIHGIKISNDSPTATPFDKSHRPSIVDLEIVDEWKSCKRRLVRRNGLVSIQQ